MDDAATVFMKRPGLASPRGPVPDTDAVLRSHAMSHSARRHEYRSVVDGWIAVTLVGTLGICLFAAYRMLNSGSVVEAVVLLLVLAGVGSLLVPVRYTIAADELVIRSGVWKIRIALRTIRRVYPSGSLLASPALSMDRLAVEYGAGGHSRPTVYISPRGREQFLDVLAQAAGLERRGDELVRASGASTG